MATVKKMLLATKDHITNSTAVYGTFQEEDLQNAEEVEGVEGPAGKKQGEIAFIGTNETCKIEQCVASADVPTLKETNYKCAIQCGAYVAAKSECHTEARVILEAIGDNEEVFDVKKIIYKDDQFSKCKKGAFKYCVLRINNPEVISKAVKFNLIIETKDQKSWKGQSGSKFTGMFFRAVPLSYLI